MGLGFLKKRSSLYKQFIAKLTSVCRVQEKKPSSVIILKTIDSTCSHVRKRYLCLVQDQRSIFQAILRFLLRLLNTGSELVPYI